MDFTFENSFFWAQVIGFAAMILDILILQLKNPRHMLLSYVPCSLLWAIQYFMLGAPVGALIDLLSAGKSGALYFAKDHHVRFIIFVYLGVCWLSGIYSFAHWYDILPMMAVTVVTLAWLERDNRPLIARSVIIGCVFWLIYNCIVGSWMAAACSTFAIFSAIIGMARHEEWQLGRCIYSFGPSLIRCLINFRGPQTYP